MKKNVKNPIDEQRRSLLKTFVASGISKAVFQSSSIITGAMIARHADAQSSGRPNKSVAVYVPGGGIHSMWAPTGRGNAMVMRGMSAQYEPVKTECNFLLNMSHSNGGHGLMPLILSSGWTGDSYDVFMGRQLGATNPFTYLNLGVHSNGSGVMTRDGNSTVPFQDNPFTAFNLLFGDSNNSGNPKTQIMSAHSAALNSIKTKLAGYEVERIDDHLDAVADTERRLNALGGGVAACPSAPNGTRFDLTFDTFTQQAHLQADIIVAALRCNLTSSCSIAFGNHQSEFRIPELNYTGVYHQSIHGGSDGRPNYPYYVEMRAHLGGLTSYLINRLRTEGLLDSTIVVETTDMGHADLHSNSDVPFMIAGGGGAVNRGRTTPGAGFNQYDMLFTAAKACGVNLDFGREIPGVLT